MCWINLDEPVIKCRLRLNLDENVNWTNVNELALCCPPAKCSTGIWSNLIIWDITRHSFNNSSLHVILHSSLVAWIALSIACKHNKSMIQLRRHALTCYSIFIHMYIYMTYIYLCCPLEDVCPAFANAASKLMLLPLNSRLLIEQYRYIYVHVSGYIYLGLSMVSAIRNIWC